MTGGTPYLATDSVALAQRFQTILEDLEKSRIKERGVLYAELFPRFLFPALAAAAAGDPAAPHPPAAAALRNHAARPTSDALVAPAGAGGGAGLGGGLHPAAAPARAAGRAGCSSSAWRPACRCRARCCGRRCTTAALVLLVLALARPQAGGRAKLERQRGPRPGGGARLLQVDARPRHLPVAARAGQARARAADGPAGGRPHRPGGLRRRDHELPAHHRLRGGQAVLARPAAGRPAGGRDRHRAGPAGGARPAGAAAAQGARDAQPGHPAAHRRRGHRERAAGGGRGGGPAGGEDLRGRASARARASWCPRWTRTGR